MNRDLTGQLGNNMMLQLRNLDDRDERRDETPVQPSTTETMFNEESARLFANIVAGISLPKFRKTNVAGWLEEV